MPIYTVQFHTEADWADHEIAADTPEQALALAVHLADDDDRWEFDFQPYESTCGVERIEVLDACGVPTISWYHPALQLRLAAPELLNALKQAVTALNTAPRFAVPELDTDSYRIAGHCDAAIRKAKGGEP